VADNNQADGVNVTPITVVASIDPELVGNLIDMEKIDAGSIDDCTDEGEIKFLVLCAAKDETSVNTMRRMFCCNFLRKSRL
jgi:hypothetical protein